jgi:hypothetical protein
MLACFLTILFFLPVIFVTTVIENLFTSDELDEMGVRLEQSNSKSTGAI